MHRGPQKYIAFLYVVVGLAPITALALSLIRLVPLHDGFQWGVLPLLLIGGLAGLQYPSLGRLATKGLLIGLLAVFLYDCTRVPFILTGAWSDFIPSIATHLWPDAPPNWVVGYTWRYFGNGGGMGVTFVMVHRFFAPRSNTWTLALTYGVGIWLCLLVTLLLIPTDARPLFALTPITLSMSFVGHVVYGGSLALGLRLEQSDRTPVLFAQSRS